MQRSEEMSSEEKTAVLNIGGMQVKHEHGLALLDWLAIATCMMFVAKCTGGFDYPWLIVVAPLLVIPGLIVAGALGALIVFVFLMLVDMAWAIVEFFSNLLWRK